jgi:hypothetical protein
MMQYDRPTLLSRGSEPQQPIFVWNLLFSVRHVCEIHTHIRESRRWFSVQRSHHGRCSEDHVPGDNRVKPQLDPLRQRSAPPWIGVLGEHAVREVQRGAAANSRRWRPSCARSRWIHSAPSGETRCPTSIRNRPLARSRHAPTDISIDKGARGYLHVAGGGGKWRKPADGSAACKKPAGGGLGHPAGKFLEGKAMHVAGMQVTGGAPGMVTIILHGADVTVKRNIPAAGCAARKSPQSMGPRRG